MKKGCDECYLCCTGILTHTVYDHRVGGDTDCRFITSLKGERCGIYEDRPEHCVKFKCFWLLEQLEDHLRPDRCGIVVKPLDRHCIAIHTLDASKEAAVELEKIAADQNKTMNHYKHFYPIRVI
jgi:Fe-S-cluster containining protein